ncbi:hypothetical protein [Phytoactinopolyspora mesophila]|uniref:Uncharacterized protein n=1 Tax=Phytoactinopolyspora mesophila TaxID=2650750 RepID=A0A7K3M7G9_9ACTN|nr:hypothetical protein [Phytoactinopolyspora mesophila]NDL58882.1 hypothetical protein [Phytoactinopolyspora mesophila]
MQLLKALEDGGHRLSLAIVSIDAGLARPGVAPDEPQVDVDALTLTNQSSSTIHGTPLFAVGVRRCVT